MDKVKVKRRRTSTKHSQTGCRTCKRRHIKCDEKRPRCVNCDKGDRECVYATKSLVANSASSLHEPASISPLVHLDNPFSFQPNPGNWTPGIITPIEQFKYEDGHGTLPAQSFETSDYFSSQGSNSSSASSTTPPQGHHSTSSTALVRNAMLVNTVQSQSTLQRAIHSLSKDFKLRGQALTIESVLTPLISRSQALKHSIFANYILKVEHAKRPLALIPPPHDPASLQERHYNTAVNHLHTILDDPQYTDVSMGVSLILAFYCVSIRKVRHWTTQIRNAAEQIRIRGKTIDTNPLSLHTKFLFYLFVRTDIVGSNALFQPANTDHDILRIVYSGIPISNPSTISCRMELEFLLAEVSRFQYDCVAYTSSGSAWPNMSQGRILLRRYHDLVGRLEKWEGLRSNLVAFEDIQAGEHYCGVRLPPEMGSPLICNDQEFAQLWVLHCSAVLQVHRVASRHRIISQLPENVQETAILCSRILSGISIIDPTEPTAGAIWSLLTVSNGLNTKGKQWVADVLDSMATRHFNRSARAVAQVVRDTISNRGPQFKGIAIPVVDSEDEPVTTQAQTRNRSPPVP